MIGEHTDQMPEKMLTLLLEAGRTFHKMKVLGRRLGAVGEEGGGSWGLMRSLVREGPQTVPQLARSRPVARQHIQMIVNGLRQDGLVQLDENPMHKRSKLVAITALGQDRYHEIEAAILVITEKLGRDFDVTDVTSAAQTLSRLNERLDAQIE